MSDITLQSKLRELKTELREMKYSQAWNESAVLSGDPVMTLRLLHFFFLDFNPSLKMWLVENGYTMQTASDLEFVQQLYKVLQEKYSYRPKITITCFFQPKYGLQKINLCIDIAKMFRNRIK